VTEFMTKTTFFSCIFKS